MSTLALPNTFSPNTTISSSQVNANFSTIVNDYNGGITSANLATDSVVTAKIADANVTTAKLADAAVTPAKLVAGTGTSWVYTAYTPTITAASGTFTTVSASGRWVQIGKTVFAQGSVVITTNGTAAGAIIMTLPATAQSTNRMIGSGRGNVVSGVMQQVATQSDATKANIYTATGTYGGASGETIIFGIVYEAV